MIDLEFSVAEELSIGLDEDYRFMSNLVKLITSDKCLIKRNDEWDRKKVLEYLNKKTRCLELLMLAMFLTGGQHA